MKVVLLERVDRLGTIGDVVTVKDGFGRNFLLPNGKALLANEANMARFEKEREQIEARNAEARKQAQSVGQKLDGEVFVIIRQAGESGQLYGSVSARDIAKAAKDAGHDVDHRTIHIGQPIKTVGMHDVKVRLHGEVEVTITANVARTNDEAERQAKGENVIESAQEAEKAEQAKLAEEQAAIAKEAAAENMDAED